MTDTSRLALLDNTVLTNFAIVHQDNLISRLWPGAATTSAAFGEYRVGVVAGVLPTDAWQNLPQISLDENEEAIAAQIPPHLGTGERSCLAIAISRSGTLVSDDLPARKWARKNGIEVTGTVGILLACVQRGYLGLAQANTLLAAMIAAGYRAPVASLDALVSAK